MSKLTDEQIRQIELTVHGYTRQHLDVKAFARAIEAAATEPLLQRIAELERRIEASKNIVRNDMHRIGQLQAQVTELERQLEEALKDAERWGHACKGNHKNINVCAWDADSYEFVGYAMKKEAIDAIADAEIAAMQKGQS